MVNFGCTAYQRNFRTTSSTTKLMYPLLHQYDHLHRIRTSVSKEQKKWPMRTGGQTRFRHAPLSPLPEGEGAMRFSFYYRRSSLLMHEPLPVSSIVVCPRGLGVRANA